MLVIPVCFSQLLLCLSAYLYIPIYHFFSIYHYFFSSKYIPSINYSLYYLYYLYNMLSYSLVCTCRSLFSCCLSNANKQVNKNNFGSQSLVKNLLVNDSFFIHWLDFDALTIQMEHAVLIIFVVTSFFKTLHSCVTELILHNSGECFSTKGEIAPSSTTVI